MTAYPEVTRFSDRSVPENANFAIRPVPVVNSLGGTSGPRAPENTPKKLANFAEDIPLRRTNEPAERGVGCG
jgi:hypothetical protein